MDGYTKLELSQGALIDTLIDAMEEVRELIEGYIDVKDDENGIACVPNDAMRADQLLEAVIVKARRVRKVGAQ